MTKQKPPTTPGTLARWRDVAHKQLQVTTTARTKRKKARTDVRPHRSFRRTQRRDYKRPLGITGYFAFTAEVTKQLLSNKRLFGGLVLLYAILVILAGGMLAQANYLEIQDIVTQSSTSSGDEVSEVDSLPTAGLVLLTSIGGDGSLSDTQQVYLSIALLLVWLTTVWLLRELLAGRAPKLRDGLYNSGSPLMSTIFVGFILILQLIPAALAGIAYAGLVTTGLATEGFGAMLAALGLALVAALTLYWLTSTLIALVVITLPGMYPMQAMRAASNLIVSRRLRVLLRIVWMIITVLLVWAVVMIPLILLESWLREQWSWLSYVPTIPLLITLMSALSSVWIASYIYLLYRKLVEDDSLPG